MPTTAPAARRHGPRVGADGVRRRHHHRRSGGRAGRRRAAVARRRGRAGAAAGAPAGGRGRRCADAAGGGDQRDGLLAAGLGATLLALLHAPALRRLAAHHRIGIAVACAGGIAVALTLLTRRRGTIGARRRADRGRRRIDGVIIVAITALAPRCATTLAFVTGLVAAMLVTRGFTTASAAAAGIGALFAIGTLRISRRHLAALADRRDAREAEAARPRPSSPNIEAHGPGWFWQTDASGRLTYLSEKVAAELAGFGVTTADAKLTDLLRVDAEATGSRAR
ncbi:hypothetical protein AB5I41_20285 [Sphingomonas sp. MMS24-JH45]